MKIFVRPQIVIILASLLALGTAFYAQEFMNLPPCEMCLWQRFLYVAVSLFALISIKLPKFKLVLQLSILSVLALSIFHLGVEKDWWEGLTSCSQSFTASSMEDLRNQIMAAPVVRCDAEVPFLFGLSMVVWSVLYSAALSLYGFKSLFIRRRTG